MNYTALLKKIEEVGIENTVIATDLDGTLLDFKSRPEDVTAPAGLVKSLQTLHRLTGGQLWGVTGRPLPFVDLTLHPFKANLSAEHHCVVREPGEEARNLVAKPDFSKIKDLFNKASQIDAAIWIEEKDFSCTIHYRDVSPERKKDVAVKLGKLANEMAATYNNMFGIPQLGLKFGIDAIEIGPNAQDKGEAIDFIMKRPENVGKIVIFFGDSDADEPAGLRAKDIYGGYYVGVGPHKGLDKIANLHFKNPEQARLALTKICERFGSRELSPAHSIS